MKRKVYLLLLAIACMCIIPMAAEAQILDKATKALGGILNALDNTENNKSNGKKISGKVYDEPDVMPQFPGGENAYREYVSKNLKYPVVAEENGVEGKVVVGMVVLKSGEISECQILKSDNSCFDKEALKFVSNMPKWIPGKVKGKTVNVRFSVPITFKLTDKKSPLDVFKTMKLPSLDGLDLIVVDKGTVNLREKSNGAKRTSWGDPITLEGWGVFSAKIFPSGWAFLPKMRHPDGFISPTVFHKAIITSFKDWMFNTAEAYMKRSDGKDVFWRIGVNKATGLVLAERNSYTDDGFHELSIGRIENNLYYPLHFTFVKFVYDSNASKCSYKKINSDNPDHPTYQITYNKAFAINTNRGIRVNLEKIPVSMLELLFLPLPDYVGNYMEMDIPSKESDVIALYSGLDYFEGCINAELMSPPYIDKDAAINAYNNRGIIPEVKIPHMKFLGLELGGDAKQFERALRNKGFTDGSGFGEDDIYLKGNVYGQISQLRIVVVDGKAKAVYVIDTANSSAAAKKRCNVYKQHLVAEYGQGKSLHADKYEINLPYGKASYESGMFDSGSYELMMYIGEK